MHRRDWLFGISSHAQTRKPTFGRLRRGARASEHGVRNPKLDDFLHQNDRRGDDSGRRIAAGEDRLHSKLECQQGHGKEGFSLIRIFRGYFWRLFL